MVSKSEKWIVALSSAYFLGEMLQLIGFGPSFLRGHLSDFGFCFAVANAVDFLFHIPHRIGLIAGFSLAVIFELFQFSTGCGDPFDVLVFVVSLVIGLVITRNQ